jgi:hypothetical protein
VTIAEETICGKEGGLREIQSREIVMGEEMEGAATGSETETETAMLQLLQ